MNLLLNGSFNKMLTWTGEIGIAKWMFQGICVHNASNRGGQRRHIPLSLRRHEWPHVVFGLRHCRAATLLRNVRALLRRAISTDASALELEFIDLLFGTFGCLYIKSMRHAHREAERKGDVSPLASPV